MMGPELRQDLPDREEDPCGDLGLAAFRYIAAEMSAAEAAAFEERLAEDHSAREAVAEMVHLSEMASAALAPSPTATIACQSRSHWMAPLAWMTAGAAACLALTATMYGVLSTPDEPVAKVTAPPVAASAAPDHVALVRRSAELRDAETRDDTTLTADEALLTVAAEIQHFDAEPNVPDWLLAAVAIAPSDCTEIQEN
jgi:hypothetical protein